MTMRTVYVLGAIALVLGGFLIFDLRTPGEGARRAERARLLPGFDRRAVQRITVARAGQPPFSLTRQPQGQDPAWRVDPGARRGDPGAVEDLLTTIDFAETERLADIPPAAAGLEPPAVVITLDGQTLQLGRADASGRGLFVRAGGEIRVGPARLRELTERGESAFRDRRLVPATLETVKALAWTDLAGRAVALSKTTAGRWETSAHVPAANDRVEEALRRLLAVRVDRFVAFPAETSGARFQVTTGAGSVSVASTPAPCGDGAVTVARRAFEETDGACLPSDTFAALWPALSAAAAPDLRLLSQSPESVTRIELVDGARRLVLEKQRGWRFITPSVSYQPDPAVIAELLATLHRTQRSASSPGAKARQLLIAGRYPESVEVSAPPDAYALLDPDPLRFRDRAVLSFAHFDVRRLRRTIPGQQPVEATTTDGDLWQPQTIDRANATRVATTLGNLHAAAFTSKPQVGKPQVKLELDVQAPGDPKPRRHTLALFASCIAQLDEELTFTLASSPCEDLRIPLTSP
jgi:hypothetical protein